MDISITATEFDELIAHLNSSDDEQAAFLFAARSGPELLGIEEVYPVPAEGFARQSPYHLALTDEVRAYVIGRATALEACLIEVHSHENVTPVWFSPTDLRGFEDWVPHVRWRLGGRPYVALVFGGEDFDALLWESDSGLPTALGALLVDGKARKPSQVTVNRLKEAGHG
jgi:hypothetical protein